MKNLTPKDWGVLVALGVVFILALVAKQLGFVEMLHHPIPQEPIQILPWNDGGTDTGTSSTHIVSRDYDPIRPRMRI